jgi:hypothetical protein
MAGPRFKPNPKRGSGKERPHLLCKRYFGSQRWRREQVQMIDISSVARDLRGVIVAAWICSLVGYLCAADKIKIDVRQSDSAIRRQLLQLTPPGAPTDDVYHYAQSQLYHEGPVVGWAPKTRRVRSGNFFWAYLGHYSEPRNLFLFPTVVQAFWDFDEHDRLRNIRVRRVVSGM